MHVVARIALPLLLLVAVARPLFAELSSPSSPLAGTWRLDPARSTELSPWKTLELTFVIDAQRLVLRRSFGWGRRVFAEEFALDLSRDVNLVPITWWPDNRHLGAYAGGDLTKRVRTTWMNDGRLLRLSSDLILDTQQGPRSVNILSDYKVSANGALLTLTELRSTRNRPTIYVFTRVSAASGLQK